MLQVASRQVFVGVGILYVLFGIFGKFSAVFITIPYPVLGGAVIVMFGIFFGVVVSNLEVCLPTSRYKRPFMTLRFNSTCNTFILSPT